MIWPDLTRCIVATKVINMLQPFVIEFKPFIDDMSQTEKRVRECADIATMDRIKSLSWWTSFYSRLNW
jgi:hypothetical protein